MKVHRFKLGAVLATILGATALASAVLLPNLFWPQSIDAGEAKSIVFINGLATEVHFSDGDSYNQREGKYQGNSRLAGFNTLESFGPAHQWGDWKAFELWVNAKQATLNARRGVWHCKTIGENTDTLDRVEGASDDDGGGAPQRDTYGRWLMDCPDLALDQIGKGFAHAMNIDDTPQRPEYIRAQQAAIKAKRGMWAHGVPSFVLTSLHSADEDFLRDQHYNRMVSTRDGHTEKWKHRDNYGECSWQCATEVVADEGKVKAFARVLRGDPGIAKLAKEISNILLIEIVDRYARLGHLPEWAQEGPLGAALTQKLSAAKAAGTLGETFERRGACAIYAQFTRRYGKDRAWCLNGHGTNPKPEVSK